MTPWPALLQYPHTGSSGQQGKTLCGLSFFLNVDNPIIKELTLQRCCVWSEIKNDLTKLVRSTLKSCSASVRGKDWFKTKDHWPWSWSGITNLFSKCQSYLKAGLKDQWPCSWLGMSVHQGNWLFCEVACRGGLIKVCVDIRLSCVPSSLLKLESTWYLCWWAIGSIYNSCVPVFFIWAWGGVVFLFGASVLLRLSAVTLSCFFSLQNGWGTEELATPEKSPSQLLIPKRKTGTCSCFFQFLETALFLVY